MSPAHEAQLKALFAKTPTPALTSALRTMEDKREARKLDQFEVMARAWTIDELEKRFPAASQAVEDAFLSAEMSLIAGGPYAEVDYVTILLANIEI